MAGISFLDLMLAEALASGLARESMRAERPPPDNFFVLPRELRAWKQIQEASKKENMVVCMEITDGVSDNCRRVRSLFLDMAREFDSIPFLRVPIGPGPGGTFDELRKDLGGIQYTPTIMVIFFAESKTFRAKFEGEGEIRNGLASGRIKAVIKEFIERRVKIKLAEHLADQLAGAVKEELSEKEQRIREEYETKMRREMAEKDEQAKKDEQEKKRKEEDEQRRMDQKRLRSDELRRQARPQHLEELMKMDVDSASAKELKQIMLKMGISTHDCFEKADLRRKLLDNVPELRIKMERGSTSRSTSGSTSSEPDGFGDPLGVSNDQVEDLKRKIEAKNKELEQVNDHLKKMTVRANSAEDQVTSLRDKVAELRRKLNQQGSPVKQVTSSSEEAALRRQVAALQSRIKELESKPVPKPRTTSVGGGDSARVRELQAELYETRTLYTTTIEDYDILGLIHDSGEEGLVLRARCTKQTLPNKERVYAMKVLTNYFQTQTTTQVRRDFQNEYQVLCQLPPHENIIHMWAFFFDRANPDISPEFNRVGRNTRTMSLFLLMDEHLQNMKEQLDTLVDNQGPKPEKVIQWMQNLLSGLVFLEQHCVVHRDLKMENLLLDSKGKVVISDFGKAVELDETFKIPYMHGVDIGGNQAHLCPEVLNAKPGPRRFLSYSKQPVWAAGVLAYELAGHPSPFAAGTIDQRGYTTDALPPLRYTYCKNSKYSQALPGKFSQLVKSMLDVEPNNRPSLQACLSTISSM